MRCCPYTMSVKGTTLLNTACTTNGHQPAAVTGRRIPIRNTSGTSASAARPTRASTSVNGGTCGLATAMKKKVAPHSTESRTSRTQSVVRMAGAPDGGRPAS